MNRKETERRAYTFDDGTVHYDKYRNELKSGVSVFISFPSAFRGIIQKCTPKGVKVFYRLAGKSEEYDKYPMFVRLDRVLAEII